MNEALSTYKQTILDHLHIGQNTANRRQWFCMVTHLSDRSVRKVIKVLRRDGFLICNTQDGSGYFLAEDIRDVERHYNQECSRALSILQDLKPFRDYLKWHADENQITFEDLIKEEVDSWE